VAPEYSLWGQLSDKADVFSFGVLLLEIVSGRRNIVSNLPEDEVYLPNYVSYIIFQFTFYDKQFYILHGTINAHYTTHRKIFACHCLKWDPKLHT
jgi:hypothetical protein